MVKHDRKTMDAAREKMYQALAHAFPTGNRIKAGYAVTIDGIDIVVTPTAKQTALDIDFEVEDYQATIAEREAKAVEKAEKAKAAAEEKERKRLEKEAKKAAKEAEEAIE